MAGNIPGTKYTTSSFLSKFGNIAQSSQYRAHWGWPSKMGSRPGLVWNEGSVLCKATSLPGSSLATHDVAHDFYGITQKSVYKRQFDNTIDLTFYIDSQYEMLYNFEAWMEFIMPMKGDNVMSINNYYKANYPEDYRTNLYIGKFNKNDRIHYAPYSETAGITYTFVNAFPQNISSTQVSYDSSQNLEFTVTFAYDRYITDRTSTVGGGAGGTGGGPPVLGGGEPLKDVGRDNPSVNPSDNGIIPGVLSDGALLASDRMGRAQGFSSKRAKGISQMFNQPTGEPVLPSQATMGGGDYNPSALSGGGKSTDLADLNAQRLRARSSGTQSELTL